MLVECNLRLSLVFKYSSIRFFCEGVMLVAMDAYHRRPFEIRLVSGYTCCMLTNCKIAFVFYRGILHLVAISATRSLESISVIQKKLDPKQNLFGFSSGTYSFQGKLPLVQRIPC